MPNKIIFYTDLVDQLTQGKFVPPITCEVDTSDACCLDCVWCLFGRGVQKNLGRHLDFTVFSKALVELSQMGTKSITFTGGGEPLMHPKFKNFVSLARAINFKIGLVTNGVLLNKAKVPQPDKLTFIRVSLNASNKKMYQDITGADHFQLVIENMISMVKAGAFVGWSYVVSKENAHGVAEAQRMAAKIGVQYIQFKPALLGNGRFFTNYKVDGQNVIDMRRYQAKDYLPCHIAHLVGIMGANGHLYYCCQHRDNPKYDLGSLAENTFGELWRKRLQIKPDLTQCPPCRYMNYAVGYQQIKAERDIFFGHKEFL